MCILITDMSIVLIWKRDGWKTKSTVADNNLKNLIIWTWLHFYINAVTKYLLGVFKVCHREEVCVCGGGGWHSAGKYVALLWSPALLPSLFVEYIHNQLSYKQTWRLHPATASSPWTTWQRCVTKIPPQIVQPKAETVRVVKRHWDHVALQLPLSHLAHHWELCLAWNQTSRGAAGSTSSTPSLQTNQPTSCCRHPGRALAACGPTAPAAAWSWSCSGCGPAHEWEFSVGALLSR